MVDVVRSIYPRYDRFLHSKVENGTSYGIQLRPDAMHALVQRFAPELLMRPRRPQRRKPNRIQARLSDALYGQLQLHLCTHGLTVQDFLEVLVTDFFAAQNAAGRAPATATGGKMAKLAQTTAERGAKAPTMEAGSAKVKALATATGGTAADASQMAVSRATTKAGKGPAAEGSG